MILNLNIPKVVQALARKHAAIKVAIARGTTKGALLVQKAARQAILRGPKSGNVYARGKKDHIASAPGEAPANDTGNLQRSITVVAAQPGTVATAQVNVSAEYGQHLEFGTINMAPRPFLQPALDNNKTAIGAIIKAEVAAAVEAP